MDGKYWERVIKQSEGTDPDITDEAVIEILFKGLWHLYVAKIEERKRQAAICANSAKIANDFLKDLNEKRKEIDMLKEEIQMLRHPELQNRCKIVKMG